MIKKCWKAAAPLILEDEKGDHAKEPGQSLEAEKGRETESPWSTDKEHTALLGP